MPFSFVQIEQDKTRAIGISILVLVLFYFIAALTLVFVVKYLLIRMFLGDGIRRGASISIFDWATFGWTCAVAALASLIHWSLSTSGMIDHVIRLMHARAADDKNEDEKRFRNVVEEAGVATGGRYRIEPFIIPTGAMNAFALQDFDGRSVIGITEGLLKRLSREQLEAVIGHEAGHIASGDCLSTTVTTTLFKVFDNICDAAQMMMRGYGYGVGYGYGRSRRDGRVLLLLFVIFLLAQGFRLIGFLGAMFISREREYRADALSVKLTRNPVALAEALHIISQRWKGGGTPGESMDAIFIQSPRLNSVEDGENWFAEIFTTHPPVGKRIGILLDMAHVPASSLDKALEAARRRVEEKGTADGRGGDGVSAGTVRWMVNQGGRWLGPFAFEEMQNLPGLTPDTLIQRVGAPVMLAARMDKDLWGILPQQAATHAASGSVPSGRDQCPRCHVPLASQEYEGVPTQRCGQCGGVLVKELDVLKILERREMMIAGRVKELGEVLLRQPPLLKRSPNDTIFDEQSIYCPHCLDASPRMTRRFVNPRYPVEIDKCRICARVWFDKDELELLQYMYEKDHPAAAAAGNA